VRASRWAPADNSLVIWNIADNHSHGAIKMVVVVAVMMMSGAGIGLKGEGEQQS
jgi:hypothetical protein